MGNGGPSLADDLKGRHKRLECVTVYVIADDFYTSTATASLMRTIQKMVDKMYFY